MLVLSGREAFIFPDLRVLPDFKVDKGYHSLSIAHNTWTFLNKVFVALQLFEKNVNCIIQARGT